MRLARLEPGTVALTGSEAYHLARVLRVKPGQPVRAFDGAGLEAEGVVVEAEPARVLLELGEPAPSAAEATLALTLGVPLLKADKLSEVVRRGTELGVVRFQLLLTRRCDVRAFSANKFDRLGRVAAEAAKQAGRAVVPAVARPVPLEELPLPPLTLVAHPGAGATLREALPPEVPAEALVVTGPEGGLEDREVDELVERGAKAVRLGARILRAETAPVALAAALLLPDAL